MENGTHPVTGNWAGRFFTIWIGQAFSLFGSSIVQFALVWWLTQKTGSATVLATATLVALLPQILLGPFAGALVDRWNRRIIMIVADAGIALTTAVLIYLFATDQIQVWHIYAAAMIRSLGGAFHQPAMTSSTSLMVPDKHLARIAGANQSLQGLINIFAPPLGALLLEVYSTQTVLMIDIATAAIAILPLLFIRIPQPLKQIQLDESLQKSSYLQDLREGFTYVVRWKGLLGLILLAMAINFLLVPASSFLPLVITKIFNGGAAELGWVEIAVWGGDYPWRPHAQHLGWIQAPDRHLLLRCDWAWSRDCHDRSGSPQYVLPDLPYQFHCWIFPGVCQWTIDGDHAIHGSSGNAGTRFLAADRRCNRHDAAQSVDLRTGRRSIRDPVLVPVRWDNLYSHDDCCHIQPGDHEHREK